MLGAESVDRAGGVAGVLFRAASHSMLSRQATMIVLLEARQSLGHQFEAQATPGPLCAPAFRARGVDWPISAGRPLGFAFQRRQRFFSPGPRCYARCRCLGSSCSAAAALSAIQAPLGSGQDFLARPRAPAAGRLYLLAETGSASPAAVSRNVRCWARSPRSPPSEWCVWSSPRTG